MRAICLAALLAGFRSSAVRAHEHAIRASSSGSSMTTPGGAGAPLDNAQDPTEEIGREEDPLPHLARLAAFAGWAEAHGKDYGTESERGRRLRVWLENDGACVPPCAIPAAPFFPCLPLFVRRKPRGAPELCSARTRRRPLLLAVAKASLEERSSQPLH
jgi:hypothetical protein